MAAVSRDLIEVFYFPPPGLVEKDGEGGFHAGSKPSLGHVAIRTSEIYASFWPKGTCLLPEARHQMDHTHKQIEDQRAYGTLPKPVVLRGLNVKALNDAYNAFKEGPFRWSYFGSGPFRLTYERNCSGLALHLLEIAGVKVPFRENIERAKRFGYVTLLTGSVSGLIGMTSYILSGARRSHERLGQAERNIKGAYESSHELNTRAIDALDSLAPTPRSKLQVAHTRFADMLLKEAVESFSSTLPEVYSAIDDANHSLKWSVAISFGLSAASVGLGYVGSHALVGSVFPSDVREVALKASQEEAPSQATIIRKERKEKRHQEGLMVGLATAMVTFFGLWVWVRSDGK